MGDPSREPAQRLHFLGPSEVLSQPKALRNVLYGRHQGVGPTFAVCGYDIVDLDYPDGTIGLAGLVPRISGAFSAVIGPATFWELDPLFEQVGRQSTMQLLRSAT